MSSKQLVDDVIINELKHHLIGSDKSFQEISYLFGFNDQAAFTQYFKRNTGMTPTGFRKKHK